MSVRRSEVLPFPLVLELSFDAGSGLTYPSLSDPLEVCDVAYRIAVGSYATSLTRVKGDFWPQARPTVISVRYGSPYSFALLVDLETFLLGSGIGTGVVGLGALLQWAWGFDLDLVARRADGRARVEAARADDAEARLRRARAEQELGELNRSDSARAIAADPRLTGASLDLVSPRQELEAMIGSDRAVVSRIDRDAERIDAALRGKRAAGRFEVLLELAGRLHRLRRSWRPSDTVLRPPTDDETDRLRLPADGSPPRRRPLDEQQR